MGGMSGGSGGGWGSRATRSGSNKSGLRRYLPETALA